MWMGRTETARGTGGRVLHCCHRRSRRRSRSRRLAHLRSQKDTDCLEGKCLCCCILHTNTDFFSHLACTFTCGDSRKEEEMHAIFMHLWLKLYLGALGAWQTLKEQVWDRHRTLQQQQQPAAAAAAGEGRLAGRLNIVITGGNRGIGFEAVQMFLKLGHHVIIGCRDPFTCEKTLKSVEKPLGGTFECLELDLLSLQSVRDFAKKILEKNVPIHVLANNAGTMFGKRRESADGFESQFATNYLGHFLLTSLLLKRLKEAGTSARKARIVNVTSVAHFVGSWIDFDDLQSRQFYSPQGAYGNSKAAQVMFTKFLTTKLPCIPDGGENVVVNCVHPGIVRTGLYQHARFIPILAYLFMKTPRQGGEAIVHACIAEDIEGQSGLYLDNSRPASSSSFTQILYNQLKLWNMSLMLVGLKEFGNE